MRNFKVVINVKILRSSIKFNKEKNIYPLRGKKLHAIFLHINFCSF